MRKKIIALVAVTFIIFFVITSIIFFVVRSYIFPYDTFYNDGKTSVMSGFLLMPLVHTNPTVDVSFDYAIPFSWIPISSFSYSLNESAHTRLTSTSWSDFTYRVYHVSGTLMDLPNGSYEVKVYADYSNGTSNEINRGNFIVNPDFKEPTLRVISPINQSTHHTNSIQLAYTIDSKIIWSYYAIDSGPNVQIDKWIPFKGNITVTDLSEGSHEIIVSVQTEASRFSVHPISSQTIDFTIDTSKQP